MCKKMLLTGALILALAAPAALAGSTSCPLEPTPKGFEVDAQGKAQLSGDRLQSVEIRMAAALDDGTVLIVSATRRDGATIDLGAISMLLGAGEFSLDSAKDRYSKAFPTGDIATLSIGLNGTALLEGRCLDADLKR